MDGWIAHWIDSLGFSDELRCKNVDILLGPEHKFFSKIKFHSSEDLQTGSTKIKLYHSLIHVQKAFYLL